MDADFKTGFFHTLWILKDYLSQIVIGGGWVPMLYYHYLLHDKTIMPIRTRDIDIFVKTKVPVIGSASLDHLLCNAGFKPIFKSNDIPPIVGYAGRVGNEEVEVEFLTVMKGPHDDSPIEIQNGLTAQALRFASILIENTVELQIDDFKIGGKPMPINIIIPSPEAYIFHKGLVYVRRTDSLKKEKDLYYMFDILANSKENKDEIYSGFVLLKKAYPSWFKSFVNHISNHFSELTSEGVVWVSNQRPLNVFSHMNDEQFRNYVLGIFQHLLIYCQSI